MQTHTIELPDHLSHYVNRRLDGHLENLGDYVVSLIEEEHQKQQAISELNAILSAPNATRSSGLSMEDIKVKALASISNDPL